MKHTIYANYGTLGYEKGTAYSAYAPHVNRRSVRAARRRHPGRVPPL